MFRSLKTSAVLLCLGAAACGPLVSFGDDAPPASRFRLTAIPADAPAKAHTGTLRLEDFEPAAELATDRITITDGAQGIAYVQGARWADRPNRMLRQLLSEHFAAAGRTVVGPAQVEVVADQRLSGRLAAFAVDRASLTATVTVDVTLTRRTALVGAQRISASAKAASDTPADLARALNSAANSAAQQLVAWAATGS
jgi:ABC-type uncharacterized transport system auxiliary subunit